MTKIMPFKALIYNQEKVGDLSKVVCPPYDVISPARQDYLHEIDTHNFIHILLGKDTPEMDRYRRAAEYFKEWQKEKIFIQDEKPSVYFYAQDFYVRGEKRTRYGFIALLYLESKNSVFGHENTHSEAKTDRLKLLKRVKANLSPIFVVSVDKKRVIQRILREYCKAKKPFIDITDDEKVSHRLWRVDSPDVIDKIEEGMRDENMFIADGHHRYEVACAYRDELKEKLGAVTGDESFNYILSYFTDVASGGLTIFPIHRLVKLSKHVDTQLLKTGLQSYFDVEEIKDKTRFFFLLEKGGRSEHIIGMYKDKRYWLLRLKNIKILDRMIQDKPQEYRRMDICVLNYLVLKEILSLSLDDKDTITYSIASDEMMQEVDSHPNYIAFFLNPVKIEQIMAVALTGNKMPPKSTYFYPKVLSGLVINKVDGK